MIHILNFMQEIQILKNLQILSKNLQYLILWPDFDREGEAIAFEIIDISILMVSMMRKS